ncbi:aldehyde dehydrogenase [Cadophora sp. DSE1049]|nr:aldehyde dehydrogenase [Cadophora sp. DSE1049]
MAVQHILEGPEISPISQLVDKSLFVSDAFVDGAWIGGSETFDVFEPVGGSRISQVASLNERDFETAIESARAAQEQYYTSTTASQRGALLRTWYELVIKNKKDLATILCLENGKTLSEAEAEVVYAADFIACPQTVMTLKQPIGVCGIITPWNIPAAMITRKVAPALAAGCAVVIKPPKETPHSCLALTKLAIEAGLPPKIIQVCTTSNRQAATMLATHPGISKLSFTGSTSVGKMLAKLAAGTLKRCSLELGGNAPFIVFDDANLDLAVECAMICKFRCSGQTCVCANRLFVQKSVAEEFTAKLVQKVNELSIGSGFNLKTTQGPLVNKAAVDKVKEHVEDAIAKGGKVEIGGHSPKATGFFFLPTVLPGATRQMKVATEETFGPLAAIFEFDAEDEAVKLANDTDFGLAGYFFSKDVGRVLRVARELQCGMVGVNTGKISAAESPFGGIKESGYGREGSK